MCLKIVDYDTMTSVMSNLREEVQSLRPLKKDTAVLIRALHFKEQEVSILKKKDADNRADYKDLKERTDRIIADKDAEIQDNRNTIAELKKQKGSVFKRVLHVVLAGMVGYAIGKF